MLETRRAHGRRESTGAKSSSGFSGDELKCHMFVMSWHWVSGVAEYLLFS
jgi:hypothetical protein